MKYSIYDKTTGLVLRHLQCSAEQLDGNLSKGEGWFPGTLDPLTQRLVAVDGDVVVEDFIPAAPEPASDYDWNDKSKRWELKPAVAQRNTRRQAARARISELEQSTNRPLRELELAKARGETPDPQTVARLQAIDEEIRTLRPDLG